MKKLSIRTALLSTALTLVSGLVPCMADGNHLVIGSESGTATFLSSTNVPGIEIKGSSVALAATADVLTTEQGLLIQKVDATVPVKSLLTGMKMRDEHMRKYIFETASGQAPDLQFQAGNVNCPSAGAGQGFACRVSGNLSVRGVVRPFTVNLKVKEQRSGQSTFHVAGVGTVKLSDYGIAPPTQFGVRSLDEVAIRLDFTGKERSSGKPEGGGQ